MHRIPPRQFLLRTTGVVLALALALPPALNGQDGNTELGGPREDRLRIGVTLGGTGFLGLVTEYQRGDWSGEITLGTLSFREISVVLTGKHYLSTGNLRPVVGLGVWSLTAWTDDGSGSAFLLRVPIAADWRFSGGHAFGVEVGLNRALAVRRLDPEDETPPSRSIVPFPGFYYRHGWTP
jgi:hypothetical protein